MSDENLYSVDSDYNGSAATAYAPTSGRIGASPAAAQAGRVALGYDASTLLQPFRLDAGGNLRTAPSNPGGGSVYVYNGQSPPPAASQYGQQVMALQPLPSPLYMPLTLDPVGALNVHEKSKATWRLIVPSIAGGASKSIFSIINGSASSVVRVQQVNLQTPYTYTTGGTVIGLSQQANRSVVMLHEMRRITAQAKGATTTTVGSSPADSADTYDTGIVAMSNATISGAATNPFHRADANSPSGLPWYLRGDQNQKTLNLRPGEGMSVTTITDTTNYTFDVEVIITVAPA